MEFSETDQFYAAVDSVLGESNTPGSGLNTISIESAYVREFNSALGTFRRHLLETEITDEWAAFLRSVRRWFHLYLTTPVEGKSLLPWCPEIGGLGRLRQNSQPVTIQLYDNLIAKRQNLLQSEQHPFLDQILESIPETNMESGDAICETERPYHLGIVVEGRRLCQLVSLWFETFDIGVPVYVVTPSDLKKEGDFDQLILMGCPRWLGLSGSLYVLNSPRAQQITFMGFEPFFTPPAPGDFYFFTGSPHLYAAASARGLAKPPLCQNYTVCIDDENTEDDRADIEPISTSEIEDIIPTIDSSKVFSSLDSTEQDEDDADVTALCHFGGLSANSGVFLNKEASIYRILLRQTNGTRLICNDIEKTPVSDLTPGDIVMFSTHGAGDMTAIIANTLLGDSAVELRNQQKDWKNKVRTRFNSSVSHNELRDKGVLSASETNFRNWLRPHTIMPGNREEFL